MADHRMTAQRAFNVVTQVLEGQLNSLLRVLERVGEDPASNTILPFGRLQGVHFGRLVVFPGALDSRGAVGRATLVFTTNHDGDPQRHLDDILSLAGGGLDRVFEHCVGYPTVATRNDESRRAFFESRSKSVNAFYQNTAGRTLEQVADERRLVEFLQLLVDEERSNWVGQSSKAVRQAIQERVLRETDLTWALRPVHGNLAATLRRVLEWALLLIAAGAALWLLLTFPWLWLLPAAFVLVLITHEAVNLPEHRRPSSELTGALATAEDHDVQNQLSASGTLQRGPFRWLVIRAALWALAFGSRNVFYKGQLAGVDTIHFARWVLFDQGRVYFLSNFDGSPESYQDDFVERVAFGLNLVFSNGQGWPRTRLLLFGGARDEQAFKAFYRSHQVPTQAWYVAPPYRGLTAMNVARNAKIRAGITGSLSEAASSRWLKLL